MVCINKKTNAKSERTFFFLFVILFLCFCVEIRVDRLVYPVAYPQDPLRGGEGTEEGSKKTRIIEERPDKKIENREPSENMVFGVHVFVL